MEDARTRWCSMDTSKVLKITTLYLLLVAIILDGSTVVKYGYLVAMEIPFMVSLLNMENTGHFMVELKDSIINSIRLILTQAHG